MSWKVCANPGLATWRWGGAGGGRRGVERVDAGGRHAAAAFGCDTSGQAGRPASPTDACICAWGPHAARAPGRPARLAGRPAPCHASAAHNMRSTSAAGRPACGAHPHLEGRHGGHVWQVSQRAVPPVVQLGHGGAGTALGTAGEGGRTRLRLAGHWDGRSQEATASCVGAAASAHTQKVPPRPRPPHRPTHLCVQLDVGRAQPDEAGEQ